MKINAPYQSCIVLLFIMLAASGCTPPGGKSAVKAEQETSPAAQDAHTPPPAQAVKSEPVVRRYEIDPRASELRMLVYRGGHLKKVGENHVITSRDFTGSVLFAEQVTDSKVTVVIPVKTLVVDDPQARKAAGPGFSGALSPEDRAATRVNMLGARVLDAQRHGSIKVNARVVGGKLPDLQLDAQITLRGTTRRVPARVTVRRETGRLVATGQLEIRQSDFGIEPFSMLAGALQVKDEVKIEYRFVAHRPE